MGKSGQRKLAQALRKRESKVLKAIKNNSRGKDDRLPKSFIIAGVLLVLLVFSWVVGILPFTVMYVQCGRAPTTIEPPGFWSGSSIGTPQEPGDKGYGPAIFKTYTCTTKSNMYPDNTPR